MKKLFLTGLVGLISLMGSMGTVVQAQDGGRPDEAMMREFRRTVQQRDASQFHRLRNLPQAPATKGAAKTATGMPADDFWFPGEWEEVQAIVVTPYYDYFSTDSRYRGYYYSASPVVPGYADVYHFVNRRWQYVATTGYYAEIDTLSTFGQVAFHVMDAIQLGDAEAWVRVESLDDSVAVLRHMAALGLRTDRMRFFEAPGNAFWYRDCGPICFYYGEGDTVGMLDIEYYPGRALDDSLPVYIERSFGLPRFTSQLEWEGGNCLVDGTGMVLTSDAIYEANADTRGQVVWDGVDPATIAYSTKPSLTRNQVRDTLQALIGTRATYILPSLLYDGGTGHVDLYADMLDENLFVFSKMPDAYRTWHDYGVAQRNMDSLCSYQSFFGLDYRCSYIPFPSADGGGNFSREQIYDAQYTRSYSNHTFVNNVIIQPCFSAVGPDGLPTAVWDRENVVQLKKAYPGYTVYCVDVRSFDGNGGAIHCITKQIPAERPVRILHPAYYGNTGHTYHINDAPVLARISCADGIADAKVVYRLDGGPWQEEPLVADEAGQYAAVMHTAGHLQGDAVQVEYYISATSATGKTVTKPMTAAQGGFYTFYLGENTAVDDPALSDAQFSIYPNPACGQAWVDIDLGRDGRCNVSIYDVVGRRVQSRQVDVAGRTRFAIDVAQLPQGVYNVVCESDGHRVARRLVVGK